MPAETLIDAPDDRLPRFSVVVPSFNYGHLIARCVGSLARQTLDDFEVIVVDDGSTDDTRQQVAEAFERHLRPLGRRALYVWQPNAGLPVARNTGIDHCRGEWILYLDADDELEPGALAAFADAAASNGKAVMFVGGYRSITPTPRGEKVREKPAAGFVKDPIANFRRFVRGRLSGVTPGSAVVRRDVADAVRFDPRCQRSQDRVFFGQILANYRVAAISQIVLRTHRHAASLRGDPERMKQAEPFIVDSLFDPAKLPPEAMALRDEFAGRYGVDVATNYYRAGWWRDSCRAYREAIRRSPRQILRFRPLSRFLRAAVRARLQAPRLALA